MTGEAGMTGEGGNDAEEYLAFSKITGISIFK